MGKLFTKIAVTFVGMAMAIGVGVAVGNGTRKLLPAHAATSGTATYTVSSKTAVSKTGTAPDGSSATYANSGDNGNSQMTSGTTETFTLKDYGSVSVTSIKAHMKRNSKTGGGTMSLSNNAVSINSKLDKTSWPKGQLTDSYTEYELLSSSFDVAGDVVLTLTSNENSWYCDYIKVTWSTPVPLTGISEVTLSSYSEASNSDATVTATAIFTPATPTEAIDWSTSNASVATIAASATYGVANITIKGEGECTFTATGHVNTSYTATSATFTVTPAIVKRVYDVKFPGNGGSDSGTAFTTSTFTTHFASGDGKQLSATATSYVYPGKNNTIKFSSSSNAGTLTLKTNTSSSIKMVILEAAKYSGDSSSLSVKFGTADAQTTGSLGSDFIYYIFTDTAANSIKLDATNRLYIRRLVLVIDTYVAEQGAYSYAATFLRNTAAGCKAKNGSTLSTAWSTLDSAWDALDDSYAGAKSFIGGVSSNANGGLVEEAIARYENIIANYSLDNFMSRSLSSRSDISSLNIDSDNAVLVVIVIASTSILALGGLLVIRRRKKQ